MHLNINKNKTGLTRVVPAIQKKVNDACKLLLSLHLEHFMQLIIPVTENIG